MICHPAKETIRIIIVNSQVETLGSWSSDLEQIAQKLEAHFTVVDQDRRLMVISRNDRSEASLISLEVDEGG